MKSAISLTTKILKQPWW